MVRKHVYETADNMVTEGKLMIDVGSGHLQSRSFYETSVNSFLLCDPSLNTALLPIGSRAVEVTGFDAKSISLALSDLSKGRIKYAMYRGMAEDILLMPDVYEYICGLRVPIVG